MSSRFVRTASRVGFFCSAVSAIGAAAGSDARANLLVNGNFSAGEAGFSTDYQLVVANGTVHTNPPAYAVVANPATAFTNAYDSYGDHTTGTGLMLFADGSGSSSSAVWRETTPSLSGGTVYVFSYFVTAADPYNLAKISVLVDGSPIDAGVPVTGIGGGTHWQSVTETFETGAAGAYTISMVDLNTTSYGNDFSLDDLSLTGPTAVPEPGSLLIFCAGAARAAKLRRRR